MPVSRKVAEHTIKSPSATFAPPSGSNAIASLVKSVTEAASKVDDERRTHEFWSALLGVGGPATMKAPPRVAGKSVATALVRTSCRKMTSQSL